MKTKQEWIHAFNTSELREKLQWLYCTEEKGSAAQAARYIALLNGHEATFGPAKEYALFSAPGRTEIGGNHTDHERGCVLAGSVTIDTIAAVALNGTDTVRIQSENYPLDTVKLTDLTPQKGEENRSVALIRGVLAAFANKGAALRGFDAYITSTVSTGSGVSSSAAYEVLLGTIANELFFGGKVSRVEIAQIGQYAENVFFGKPCGLMDQTASSVGNIITIDFADREHPLVKPVDVDFAKAGLALCILDSGADHADLTEEYAAITQEQQGLAAEFGKEVLNEVPEALFWEKVPALRQQCGDRAVLRAVHFYQDNARVPQQVEALQKGDFSRFLALVTESGFSSYMYLQNVTPAGYVRSQPVAVALAAAQKALRGKGAFRVHGGGFAGTIQAFVPLDILDAFKAETEAVLGDGRCHVLNIRPIGGIEI